MLNDNLNEQNDAVNLLAAQVKKALRIWPVILIIGGILGAVITATVKVVRYDDNVIKKPDMQVVIEQNKIIMKHQSDISTQFSNYRYADSLDKINIKNSLNTQISATNKVVRAIQKQCENINRNVAFVTERKDPITGKIMLFNANK